MPTEDTATTFGRLVVALGLASQAQVDESLADWRAVGDQTPFDRFLIAHGVLRAEDAQRVLEVLSIARTSTAPTQRLPIVADTIHDGAAADSPSAAGAAAGAPSNAVAHQTTLPGGRPASASVPADGCRWEILGELGQGGMGVVYKARHIALDRLVALKVLGSGGRASPEELARFRREAQSAARLHHPGIVEVYEVGELDGRPYIAMECVDGEPLHEYVARARPGLHARVGLLRAVAEAVEHAHAQGIVHRDLKPANVLVDRAGKPRVADFGLAKEIRGDEATQLTRSGAVLGTPQYMSPEQADGESRHVDARSDVFSLGVMLYQTLTDRLPFEADGAIGILLRVAHDDPAPPRRLRPETPADLETICLKALEKDPARRYPSADAFALDLGRWLDGEPVAARPISGAQRLLRRAARHRRSVAVVAVLLSVAAVLAVAVAVGSVDRARLAGQAESDRKQAESAQSMLRKAALVSKTLARWRAVAPAVRGLERFFHDSRLEPEARRHSAAGEWGPIETFLRDTPEDPTSRATARAFAGWARRLAGEEQEGLAWMREATALDPDLPFGPLLEAVVLLARLTEHQPLPLTKTGEDGVVFAGVPAEPPALAACRREMEERLDQAARAPVWGKESAEDARSAVDALRAWQVGDYAAAEAGLSRAIAGPDLAAVEIGLRLARAQSRYLQKRFAPALEDMDAVRAARPGNAAAWRFSGLFRFSAALEAEVRGEDPRTGLAEAEAALREAIACDPADLPAWIDLGNVLGRRGTVEAARGGDRRPFSQGALAAYDQAVARRSGDPAVYNNRGTEWLALGAAAALSGGDPRADFERALADFAECLKRTPHSSAAKAGRGATLQSWGGWEAARGADPRPRYREARAEFDAAMQLDPSNESARANRGNVLCEIARAERDRDGDPRPWLELALQDFDATLAARPRSLTALIGRGGTLLLQADTEARTGTDPRPGFARAIADWEAVLAIHPDHAMANNNLGVVHLRSGLAAQSHGDDPLPHFERSVAAYGEAVKRNPAYVNAWFNRGRARGKLARVLAGRGGDPAETWSLALADFDEAVKLNPQDAPARFERALAASALADLAAVHGGDPGPERRRAVADCADALGVNPRLWEAAFLQGQLLEALGEIDRAIAAYEAAAALVPGHGQVRARLEAARTRRK